MDANIPNQLRALADSIEDRTKLFDMRVSNRCAMAHARAVGLVKAIPSERSGATPIHREIKGTRCGCPVCADYHELAERSGISYETWYRVYARRAFPDYRSDAAKYFRDMADKLQGIAQPEMI